MTYEEYVVAYESLLKTFLSYTGTQVGSGVYASKLRDLEDANPHHATRYDTIRGVVLTQIRKGE
jgi:hypothetical protein